MPMFWCPHTVVTAKPGIATKFRSDQENPPPVAAAPGPNRNSTVMELCHRAPTALAAAFSAFQLASVSPVMLLMSVLLTTVQSGPLVRASNSSCTPIGLYSPLAKSTHCFTCAGVIAAGRPPPSSVTWTACTRNVTNPLVHQKNTSRLPDMLLADRCSTVVDPSTVCQAGRPPWIFCPVTVLRFAACQSSAGDHEKTISSLAALRPATCSTVNVPSNVRQAAIAVPGTSFWLVFALTSTAFQSALGVKTNTSSSPPVPCPAMCSTVDPPSGVVQLVSGVPDATFLPALALTLTTCQFARGDQKNTSRLPDGSRPARCS